MALWIRWIFCRLLGARRVRDLPGWGRLAWSGLLDGVAQRADEGRGRGRIRRVAIGGQVDVPPEVAKDAGLDSGRAVGAQCQTRHGGHAHARGDQCLLDDDVVAGVRDGRDARRYYN